MFRFRHVAAAFLTLITATNAHAAGFEKSVLWSAKWSALAGAASSSVSGPDALYFNPAGLAGGTGFELSANISPTSSSFEGPIPATTSLKSASAVSPVFGALVSYKVNDRFGLGVGAFASGGTRAKYEAVDYTPFSTGYDTLKPTIESELNIVEFAGGAGYELIDGLRMGISWRVLKVKASLKSATPISSTGNPLTGLPVALVAVQLNDLEDTRFNGFKVGAQYAPQGARFGAGIDVRTPVNFLLKGTLTGQAEGSGQVGNTTTQQDLTGLTGGVEAVNAFPLQISIGGHYVLNEPTGCTLLAQYTFTRYAVNQKIDLTGAFTIPAGIAGASALTRSLSDIEQAWHNQSNYRLAYQTHLFADMDWRLGYALTTQVTATDRARATFASPGKGHTVAFGAGKIFGKIGVDGAVEYSFASGNGTNELGRTGDFSTKAYVGHLSARYSF